MKLLSGMCFWFFFSSFFMNEKFWDEKKFLSRMCYALMSCIFTQVELD